MQRFELGQTVVSHGAEYWLHTQSIDPSKLLSLHAEGDWGELWHTEREANEDALANGKRLTSRYVIFGEPVWVVTEADRSVTTVLLPSER